MLKDHICPNCRMWAYVIMHGREGYYCFEDYKWIMEEPIDGSKRYYIPYYNRIPCPKWRKRFDICFKGE